MIVAILSYIVFAFTIFLAVTGTFMLLAGKDPVMLQWVALFLCVVFGSGMIVAGVSSSLGVGRPDWWDDFLVRWQEGEEALEKSRARRAERRAIEEANRRHYEEYQQKEEERQFQERLFRG